jgi:type IV secretory pathway VirB2 component (pilin)
MLLASITDARSRCANHIRGQVGDYRNHKALLFGMALVVFFQLLLGSWSAAGGLEQIATQVCTWAPTVANIGLALAFIVFIAGIAMIAVGSRDGFGRTIWAILGSVALFGATALFQALTGTSCGAGGG